MKSKWGLIQFVVLTACDRKYGNYATKTLNLATRPAARSIMMPSRFKATEGPVTKNPRHIKYKIPFKNISDIETFYIEILLKKKILQFK